MKLISYKSLELFHVSRSKYLKEISDVPGVKTFANMFTFFGSSISFADRTNNITTPINFAVVDKCRLPAFRRTTERYEDLCNRRARQLLDLAIAKKKTLLLMYSGGIDSSLCLVSLLKVSKPSERSHILLLMNKMSIIEHQSLYDNHIRGRLNLDVTEKFPYLLGDERYVFVTGEGNDQLFGSAVLEKLIRLHGAEIIHRPSTRENIVLCFDSVLNSPDESERIYSVLQKVVAAAPIPIETVHQWFWWINFSCKWQDVYFRVLLHTDPANRSLITRAYVDDYFEMFFAPSDFQQWSMSNANHLIGSEWRTYKQVCKDIIHDFNPDESYRANKTKKASLMYPIAMKAFASCMDDGYVLRDTFDCDAIMNHKNSFADP